MIEEAMDEFWSRQNRGPRPGKFQQIIGPVDRREEFVAEEETKVVPIRRPGMYNKSKVIKIYGPNGGMGEVYANGKLYIVYPDGGYQTRSFPSRPVAIRTMMKKGWVLE